MPDFIYPIGRGIHRESFPTGTEDVPHVMRIPEDFDERVADQAGFPQGRRENRPVTNSLKRVSIVAADGKTDGGLHGYGDSSAPSTGIAVYALPVPKHIHWKDSMFVETSELPQFDNRMP